MNGDEVTLIANISSIFPFYPCDAFKEGTGVNIYPGKFISTERAIVEWQVEEI